MNMQRHEGSLQRGELTQRWLHYCTSQTKSGLVQLGWMGSAAIALSLVIVPASRAQQALPPPPSVPDSSLPPLGPPVIAPPMVPSQRIPSAPDLPGAGYPQESVYQMPGQVLGAYGTGTYGAAYQVIVMGDSEYLLRQIKFLDSKASIQEYQGRRVIVAGTFDNDAAAQKRVLALGEHGIVAQAVPATMGVTMEPQRAASVMATPLAPAPVVTTPMVTTPMVTTPMVTAPVAAASFPAATMTTAPWGVTTSTQMSSPQMSSPQINVPPMTSPQLATLPQGSHYQVVVPTSPENFSAIANKMAMMGVRPDAIQAKRQPLGPHVAVGPFFQRSEAEGVSRYLRSGGMDARVFYVQ